MHLGFTRVRVAVASSAVLVVAALAAPMLTSADAAPATPTPQGWSMSGQNYQNTRSNDTQSKVGPSNAAQLATKWTFETHGDVSATPAVVGGAVYFPDWGGYLNKVDAQTGALIWQRKMSAYGYNTSPDLVSRTTPTVVGNVVYLGDQGGNGASPQAGRVLAVDARDGHLLWSRAINPHPYSIITQSPIVQDGTVYVGTASGEEGAASAPDYNCCTFRGSFSALDARTGQVKWTTYMVPEQQPGEAGRYSGGAVWGSTPALDAKSGTVYITTGNNYTVPDAAKDCQEGGGSAAECLDPSDHVDSLIALDTATGAIKWSTGVQGFDDWIVACNIPQPNTCPTSTPGPDYDFGSGPNLFTATMPNGDRRTLVGAGQKSGIYWALDAKTGQIVWSTEAGPGSALGGIEWGTATDGKRIYVAEGNGDSKEYPGRPELPHTGSWAALDPATGKILWQTPDPSGSADYGAVSTSNGVVYAGSMSGHMYALNGATGEVLNDLEGAGSSNAGPAIGGNGVVYWGNGYSHFGLGTASTTFYAFSLNGR